MKILQFEKVDNCLEAKNVYDFVLDTMIDENFVNYLAKLGKLTYIQVFENPFFRIICRGKYTLRGSLNNQIVRCLLPDEFEMQDVDELKEFILKYEK